MYCTVYTLLDTIFLNANGSMARSSPRCHVPAWQGTKTQIHLAFFGDQFLRVFSFTIKEQKVAAAVAVIVLFLSRTQKSYANNASIVSMSEKSTQTLPTNFGTSRGNIA